MLNNASGFRKVYVAAGYTDLRRGIDGLASIVKFNFQLDPYEKDILFLFCGRRSDRIKGLVWEGDGFLLLYKRLELGGFSWPRTKEEALEMDRYDYLIVNDDLQECVEEMHQIIQGEHRRSFRNAEFIEHMKEELKGE